MPASAENNWLKDAIIYNILIDRFARDDDESWLCDDYKKPHFCGGNLEGVIARLDYLQKLGINTILLTPFHPTPVYHGYHVLDFYGVDPRFGTMDTVKRLLDEAHKRKIRVIMDFVLNHVSDKHPFFLDARRNPKSQYRSWFHFIKWPKEYVSFLNCYELPKLDLSNHEVKEHILGAARYWIDQGFDGLRLDHVLGVSHRFLHELRATMKHHNRDCVLIGETAIGRIKWRDLKTLRIRHKFIVYLLSQARINTNFFLQLQYRTYLDGVFDFFFRDLAESYVARGAWHKPRWLLKLILVFHYRFYPPSFSLISLLDNIDLDRFAIHMRGDIKRLKRAAELQFAQPQPVMLLYGTEAGIKQEQISSDKSLVGKHDGDLEIRATMPWSSIDKKLFNFYKKLISHKKKHSMGKSSKMV